MSIFKTHPILIFLILLQALLVFDAVMLEGLAYLHRLPVMFLPFHLQSDPVSANEFVFFAIGAIAYLGFMEWSIIDQ